MLLMTFGAAEPYSQKTYGDLGDYLRERDGGVTDNSFVGPEHFFAIVEKFELFGFFQTSLRELCQKT